MNHFRPLFAALIPALFLAACATATPYQPRVGDSSYGYADQPIESNRYRVTFAGNSLTSRDTVETYLLYRAAQLTLEKGYDYFVVADQDMAVDTRYREYFGGAGLGAYYWYPRFGVAAGTSTSTPVNQYEARCMIQLFNGSKPAENPAAYDAHEVIKNLENLIARPQSKVS